ncbi:MAG TPA: glutamine synthetase beta-grasp domain-containing protein, partial [Nitrospiria bacterium]|nr:glutamine synthetase beta-grasp domain-containing protein [Nitrospiria bacterium]
MATPAKAKSGASKSDVQSVFQLCSRKGIKIVDFKFVDLPGMWQHFSIPVGELSEEIFDEGIGFDGSSIRGFQVINESDMLLFPDPSTAVVDPACSVPTLSLICDVKDPITGNPYERDPRQIAHKAEAYLKSTSIADTAYFGPEVEFFLFDSLRFDYNQHSGYFFVDSDEGIWNSGQNGTGKNLGYRPRYKEGYFPVPPSDSLQDIRSEIVLKMIEAGIQIEVHHHEVATAGQNEIDMRFNTLTKMADQV